LKGLLTSGGNIDYIEVFYLSLNGGPGNEYQIDHVTRYENCFLTKYEVSGGDGYPPEERVSFTFTKACYRSYKYDQSGNPTQKDSCFDRIMVEGGCSCNF
jgi:hypothetical protein